MPKTSSTYIKLISLPATQQVWHRFVPRASRYLDDPGKEDDASPFRHHSSSIPTSLWPLPTWKVKTRSGSSCNTSVLAVFPVFQPKSHTTYSFSPVKFKVSSIQCRLINYCRKISLCVSVIKTGLPIQRHSLWNISC